MSWPRPGSGEEPACPLGLRGDEDWTQELPPRASLSEIPIPGNGVSSKGRQLSSPGEENSVFFGAGSRVSAYRVLLGTRRGPSLETDPGEQAVQGRRPRSS